MLNTESLNDRQSPLPVKGPFHSEKSFLWTVLKISREKSRQNFPTDKTHLTVIKIPKLQQTVKLFFNTLYPKNDFYHGARDLLYGIK